MKIDKEIIKWIEEELDYAEYKHPNQKEEAYEWNRIAEWKHYTLNCYYCAGHMYCGTMCQKDEIESCAMIAQVAILLRGIEQYKGEIIKLQQKRRKYIKNILKECELITICKVCKGKEYIKIKGEKEYQICSFCNGRGKAK